MIEAAGKLGPGYEFLIPQASTIDWVQLNEFVTKHTRWQKAGPIHLVPDAREALFHSQAAIVASGTATVQAALIGNPFVVVYNVSALTFGIARQLVQYPPEVWPEGTKDSHGNLPIAMVNLVAGKRIVPELLQQNFSADKVVAALKPLLSETPQRTRMIQDLAEVRDRLQPPTSSTAIAQVADALEQLMSQKGKV